MDRVCSTRPAKRRPTFLRARHTSDYAATHVASLLFRAQRGKQLLNLIETEAEPEVIQDPLRRREVRLQRVKLGVGLPAERNDLPSALRAALRGAEAVKSDDAIAELLESNLDLSAAFAEESVTRRLLLDGTKVSKHGSLIAELMLKAARANQLTLARAYRRQFSAWLQRRDAAAEENRHGRGRRLWNISIRDVAALTEAEMLMSGPKDAFESLSRWTPHTLALAVAQMVVPRLLSRGRNDLIQGLLQSGLVGGIFAAWLAVPLLRGGIEIPAETLQQTFEPQKLRCLFPIQRSSFDFGGKSNFMLFDTLLTAYELAARGHRDDAALRECLNHLSPHSLRHSERLWDHDAELLNIFLRAYCLLAVLEGREAGVGDFLGPNQVSKPDEDDSDKRGRNSLRTIVSLLIPFFAARAEAMVSGPDQQQSLGVVGEAARRVRNSEYRLSTHSRQELYQLLMLNIFDLAAIPDADAARVLETALSVPNEESSATGWWYLTFVERAGISQRTHGKLLEWATKKDANIAALPTNASEKIAGHLSLARASAVTELSAASIASVRSAFGLIRRSDSAAFCSLRRKLRASTFSLLSRKYGREVRTAMSLLSWANASIGRWRTRAASRYRPPPYASKRTTWDPAERCCSSCRRTVVLPQPAPPCRQTRCIPVSSCSANCFAALRVMIPAEDEKSLGQGKRLSSLALPAMVNKIFSRRISLRAPSGNSCLRMNTSS